MKRNQHNWQKGWACFWLVMTLGLVHNAFAETVTSDGFSYDIAPVPDWVTTRDYVAPESLAAGQDPVRYITSDEQLYIHDKDFQRFRLLRLQAVSDLGRNDVSRLSFYFAPEYQTFNLHYVRRLRAGVATNITQLADIRLAQQEQELDNSMYNGLVSVMILAPDIQVGDTLEVAFTINGTNPIYGDKRFAVFPTNWGIEVDEAYIRIDTDADRPLYTRLTGSDKSLEKQQTGGRIVYTWQDKQLPEIKDEAQYPAWYDPYGKLEVSEFADWQQVVNWALPLYPLDIGIGKDLSALQQTLLKQTDSKQAYLQAVVEFVQNDIRYFGLEVGHNTHQPFTPDEVFARKYGDCKDKAYLMSVLLNKAGIEAYPALVSAAERGGIERQWPSPGAFDHVITYVRLDGKTYWIDGTQAQQFGEIDEVGQQYFQRALLVKPKADDLAKIPLPSQADSIEITDEHFAVKDYSAPVTLESKLTFKGKSAQYFRVMLSQNGKKAYQEHLENYYQRFFPTATLTDDLVIDNDVANNQVRIDAVFTISDFFHLAESQLELPLFGDSVSPYINLPEVIQRKMPLAVEPGVQVQHRVQYSLPEQVNWKLDDTPVSISDNAMNYEREITTSERGIQVTHNYLSKQDVVPVDEVSGHISKLKRVRESVYFSASVSNGSHDNSAIDKLNKRLRSLLNKTSE